MSALLERFQDARILSSDAKTKSVVLLGTIDGQSAILVAEKTAFDENVLQTVIHPRDAILDVSNNVYHKIFVAVDSDARKLPSAKYSLIFPATETHIKKYSPQRRRIVKETPELYKRIVVPYIQTMTGERLRWVYNILDHKAESDRILFEDSDPEQGFILLPDLKWDGKTLSALYILCLVNRRDLTCLRDLTGGHVQYLSNIRSQIFAVMAKHYQLAEDQLRLYVHYHPSYYHLHIHVQTCETEAGEGLSAGKAILLDDIIDLLAMDSSIFQKRTLHYTLGEGSDLYRLMSV